MGKDDNEKPSTPRHKNIEQCNKLDLGKAQHICQGLILLSSFMKNFSPCYDTVRCYDLKLDKLLSAAHWNTPQQSLHFISCNLEPWQRQSENSYLIIMLLWLLLLPVIFFEVFLFRQVFSFCFVWKFPRAMNLFIILAKTLFAATLARKTISKFINPRKVYFIWCRCEGSSNLFWMIINEFVNEVNKIIRKRKFSSH